MRLQAVDFSVEATLEMLIAAYGFAADVLVAETEVASRRGLWHLP